MSTAVSLLIVAAAIYGNFFSEKARRPYFIEELFCYFTSISNILVLAFQLLYLLGQLFPGLSGLSADPFFQYAATSSILLTFLVYVFILYPYYKKRNDRETDPARRKKHVVDRYCLCVHYLVPLLQLLWWILCGDKDIPFVYTALCLAVPSAYDIWILLRKAAGRKLPGRNTYYPYPYVDPEKVGMPRAILGIAGSLLIMFGVNCITYLISTILK